MNSQELRALQEAYSQVYELDENRMDSRMEKMPSAPAKVGKATHSIKDIPVSREPSPEEKAKARKALKLKESDLYDIILSHLLDEGYADTEQAAEAIMVNMSEDWRESIVEEVFAEDANYDRNRKRAAQRAAARNAARDAGKTGAVPGVGYVTPRRESETYRDSAGVERHKSGAKNA
jgi:hypothetical protein